MINYELNPVTLYGTLSDYIGKKILEFEENIKESLGHISKQLLVSSFCQNILKVFLFIETRIILGYKNSRITFYDKHNILKIFLS